MGPQGIITIVLLSLSLMVGMAFLMHTMERNRRERMHKEAILRKKLGDLQYMLNNFPDGFLGAELKVLICKSLLDVFHQLSQVDPRNNEYKAHIDQINTQAAEIQKKNAGAVFKQLENPVQIKEIRALLGMLSNYITRLKNQKVINSHQVNTYAKQLQALLMQTNIDTLLIAAKQSEASMKNRLAIHNYKTALDKIHHNNLESMYGALVEQYEERLEYLEAYEDEHNPLPGAKTREDAAEQWDEFLEEKPDWQKKSQYD